MMTHNDFDFYEDLIRPLMKFLIQMNILQSNGEESEDEDGEESESEIDDYQAIKQQIKQSGSMIGKSINRLLKQSQKIKGLQGYH